MEVEQDRRGEEMGTERVLLMKCCGRANESQPWRRGPGSADDPLHQQEGSTAWGFLMERSEATCFSSDGFIISYTHFFFFSGPFWEQKGLLRTCPLLNC